jgi:endoribonuclease LACTB2
MNVGDPPRHVAPSVWAVAVPTATLPPWRATNAFVVGGGGVGWLVDPGGHGPEAEAALDALLAAAGVRTLKGVLLTHTHADHVGGVLGVLARHGLSDVLVHPAGIARLPVGVAGRPLAPGRRLVAGPAVVQAIATPGHASDPLAFWLDDDRVALVGDLVAGRGSTWVGVPDGDVADHLASLARIAALDPAIVAPSHGPLRDDGRTVLDDARTHRLDRERAIWAALAGGPATLDALEAAVYPDLEPAAAAFARRSLLAHLQKLMRETRVAHLGDDERGPFARAPGGA